MGKFEKFFVYLCLRSARRVSPVNIKNHPQTQLRIQII